MMFSRKRKIIIISLLSIFLFVLFVFMPFNAPNSGHYYNELLVRLKGGQKIYKVSVNPLFIKLIEKTLFSLPLVDYVEVNYSFQAAFMPTDSFYSQQWYLNKIRAPQAWDFVRGGSQDIVIAVLDTGVDIDHPDLKENIWLNKEEIRGDGVDNDNNGYIDDLHGWDFVRNVPDPRPKFDEDYNESGIHHGTLVAGIASGVGNNKQGVVGLAWGSKIMPLRVLNSQGTGSVEHVIRAVRYAVNNGAKVINLSFVGTSKSFFLAEALRDAWRKGVIVVAAAGNETINQPVNLNKNPNYPICLDKNDNENFIIGVAAVDDADHKALFSDFGSMCVDVSAPGTRIYGILTYNPNYENYREYYGGYWSGTSIATPIVSGLAALTWSVNPLFTQKQIQDFILSQADNIDSFNPGMEGELGSGRVNAYATINYAYSQLGTLHQSHYIITGAGPGGGPHVRVFDSAGLPVSGFFAYDDAFRGGVQVAAGDLKGDGIDEIITGAGPGGGPHVRVFDINGYAQAGFFAYDDAFRGGVQVAAGDVDGDGIDEIVTAPGPNGNSNVKVFDIEGNVKADFFAYDKNFQGKVNVAVGDVDGDGIDEIITGAGPGGGPHVRVFDGQGNVKFHFFAFNKNFLGGVNVAVGDVDGDGQNEILASVASEASAYIRVFDSKLLLLRLQFLSYSKDFYYGVNVATADFDEDNRTEIIVAPNASKEPQINIFTPSGDPVSRFYSYSRYFHGGVTVATMRAN